MTCSWCHCWDFNSQFCSTDLFISTYWSGYVDHSTKKEIVPNRRGIELIIIILSLEICVALNLNIHNRDTKDYCIYK